jgi:hypothetical protein
MPELALVGNTYCLNAYALRDLIHHSSFADVSFTIKRSLYLGGKDLEEKAEADIRKMCNISSESKVGVIIPKFTALQELYRSMFNGKLECTVNDSGIILLGTTQDPRKMEPRDPRANIFELNLTKEPEEVTSRELSARWGLEDYLTKRIKPNARWPIVTIKKPAS